MESRTLNSQMLRGDTFQNMSPLLERLGFVGVGVGVLACGAGVGCTGQPVGTTRVSSFYSLVSGFQENNSK